MTRLVETCGLCGRETLRTVLSLGASPPTCNMLPVGHRRAYEQHHPLELLRCDHCTLVQLSVVVDPSEVFPDDYPYSSGNSRALHDNFADLAHRVHPEPDDLVVDIGANDGTLLSKFGDCRTVGVEPTGQARKIASPTYQAFFTEKLARQIREEHGPAQVITACNVLAHVDDIHDVMAGIRHLLADDGVLVAENHDLAEVVEGQWDTVYHEHLRFFDGYSFRQLLRRHGLDVTEFEGLNTHGGSFRTFAEKGLSQWRTVEPGRYDFDRLARVAADARHNLRDQLGVYPRPAWGIGATARATTIINYCGLDVEDVECVCEVAGSDKIGRYVPGTRIPIVDEAKLIEEQPRHAVLFSWHLADKIEPALRERGYRGQIVSAL